MTQKEDLLEIRLLDEEDKDIHKHHAQVDRQKKAHDCKVLKIDKERQEGIFAGSDGNSYETTLDDCTCRDFSLRHYPCKHMYRLVSELGLFSLPEKDTDWKAIYKEKIGEMSQDIIERLLTLLNEYDRRPNYGSSEFFWHTETTDREVMALIEEGFLEKRPSPPGAFIIFSLNKNIVKLDLINTLILRCEILQEEFEEEEDEDEE